MGDYISNFRQGDSKIIKIDYGTGIDITGWKFWFTIKEDLESKKIIAQVITTAGDDPNDDVLNGLVYITLDSATSETIPPDKYYYDVQVSKGGVPPIIKTIIPPVADYKDRVIVVPGVTQVSV